MLRPPRDPKTMKTTLPNRIQRLLNGGKDSSWPGAIADSVPFYSCSATEVRKVDTQITARPREQVIAAIQALDLDPIKFKLMDPEEGQGWSREYVDQMAIEYKRFLTLSVRYPDETIAPSKDVDKFWHGHILDTMKYAEDCEKVFGYFLHHFPYFGMRGEEDAAALAQAGEGMARLYAQEFGEPMPQGQAAYCSAIIEAAYCSAATKAADGSASPKAAYCPAAIKAAATKAAYCSAGTKAAYCSASTTQAAYCSASANASYCSASKKADMQTRPVLAKAA